VFFYLLDCNIKHNAPYSNLRARYSYYTKSTGGNPYNLPSSYIFWARSHRGNCPTKPLRILIADKLGRHKSTIFRELR